MREKRTQRVLINSFYGILYKIVCIVFPFIIRTILIKLMGEEYAGLNSLFTSVLSVLSLAELGFSNAVVFAMYKPIANMDYEHVSALLNYFRKIYKYVGIAVTTIGLCFVPFIDKLVTGGCPDDINLRLLYLLYLANISLGYFLFSYRTALFLADQRNDIITKIMLATTVTQYILQVLSLILFRNYYIYLWVFVLIVIPQNILYYIVSKRMYPRCECKGILQITEKETIASQVKALIGHKMGATLIISVDSIVISSFIGLLELSRYGNYYYIISSVVAFGVIVSQSMLGSIGNKIVTSSKKELKKVFDTLSFGWWWFVSWCTISLFCLCNPFVTLWLGKEYCYPQSYVLIMSIYYFSWQFRNMGLTFKDAAGLWKRDWFKPYLGVAVNIVMSISLVIATKNVLSVLIPTILIMLFIYFPIETNVLFKDLFNGEKKKYYLRCFLMIIQTIISGLVTFYIVRSIDKDGAIGFVIKAVIVFIVPNIMFGLMNFKNKCFVDIMDRVRHLVFDRRSEQ